MSYLDDIRKDLIFQLGVCGDLDWDYFLETAIKAKGAADLEKRNYPQLEDRTALEVFKEFGE